MTREQFEQEVMIGKARLAKFDAARVLADVYLAAMVAAEAQLTHDVAEMMAAAMEA